MALHIHERVSAQAVMRVAARQDVQRGLWADPQQDYHEAVQFYQHDVDWSNRLILGDSLAVMNSLSKREDLAGKVQMIYVDPPYGINFRSNFQPLVRNRNVRDGEADLTRELEMVKAYRDTWLLGVHTYLAYLKDRLVLARELLSDSGSVFVQIGEENVHRVRAILDDVFGERNFCSLISFETTTGQTSVHLAQSNDFLVWYAKDLSTVKFNQMYRMKLPGQDGGTGYRYVLSSNHSERSFDGNLDESEKLFMKGDITSQRQGRPSGRGSAMHFPVICQGRTFEPRGGRGWSTTESGMKRLINADRVVPNGINLAYRRLLDDSPVIPLVSSWRDTGSGFMSDKTYVVQTNSKVIERCMLMTTDPGDLVLDPTCGSGTTAYVAEQWGRRWITIDTSRVAIALARQRILTARFDYYKTEDGSNTVGPENFLYKTVPHITPGGIANNVALDPIFAKWEPILDQKLADLNDALSQVDDDTRTALLSKLEAKRRKRPRRDYPITDADERRWNLPRDRWEHWEVPFDADRDYPTASHRARGSLPRGLARQDGRGERLHSRQRRPGNPR